MKFLHGSYMQFDMKQKILEGISDTLLGMPNMDLQEGSDAKNNIRPFMAFTSKNHDGKEIRTTLPIIKQVQMAFYGPFFLMYTSGIVQCSSSVKFFYDIQCKCFLVFLSFSFLISSPPPFFFQSVLILEKILLLKFIQCS